MKQSTNTLQSVRAFARQPYAFPGGYPIILIMVDGETICAKCARDNYRLISDATRNNSRDGWQAAGTDIHWEGEPLNCANCNATTESAYGDAA
jgi:hypothetical protein